MTLNAKRQQKKKTKGEKTAPFYFYIQHTHTRKKKQINTCNSMHKRNTMVQIQTRQKKM